ncbi:MAG: ABC transporter permease [Chitinophaga sp.]|uniref:ABC transporter permease n=1 Tax=Chitinophaga sp. TaxID=1869181 RepID=UPI001B1F82EB|nr:ABC transporter permease [Chitinophaga sp.]MBO9731541.1 ABC transporter permease [Chitinophaga sp.]
MFKSYWRNGWKNLLKNKLSALINIGGLSIGLATGILILLWINDEFSFDAFHQNSAHLFRIMENRRQEGSWQTSTVTQGPLMKKLVQDLPEIKYASRIAYGGQGLMVAGNKSLYQESVYTDPAYFKMFTFPAVNGDPVTALQEPGNIVLTESAATRIFGNADAMGKILKYNNIYDLKVAAIVRDVPPNSSTKFDVVLPFRLYEKENADWIEKWDNYRLTTWVQLQPGANLDGFNEKLKTVSKQTVVPGDGERALFAYPFSALRMHGEFRNGQPSGGRIQLMMLLGTIGGFILLIACINFMNLSTARSERRAREVGVRKALGASRTTIILQFLVEALLITFLAMVLGILLAKLTIPGLNRISGRSMAFGLGNWKILLSIVLLTFLTGLVAGSYPAFFLSSFQPVKVLKGPTVAQRGGGAFRKTLVTFQFVISIFLIITTIVLYRQIQYGENRPVGYNQDQLIEIPVRGDMNQQFALIRDEFSRIPEIEQVSAGSDDLLRFGGATDGIQWPGKTADQNFPVTLTWVQYNWVKTAGLQLAAGRDFSPEYGSDSIGCLVNEAAVRRMGLKEPIIGTLLGKNPIIGVVKDFVANDPYQSPNPMVVFLNTEALGHFFVRLRKTANPQTALVKIEAAIKKSNPTVPFEFHFIKESYQQKFNGIRSSGLMLNWTGGLAILISCLGLFGLSSFLAERRTKEIGVRKIMGASAARIWFMLATEFLKPVFIAFIITVPLAILAMQQALKHIDYRVELQWWMFLAAGVLTTLVALATISYQGLKAAAANPVKALQTE